MTFINLAEDLFTSNEIPPQARVIFVSDAFASDYKGGAELTTEALLETSPFEVFRIRSDKLNMALLEKGFEKYWIFGNYANMNKELIPSIVANLKYSIIEYDFKYCKYRSPEKHAECERKPCDCANEQSGKLVSAFMYGARSLFWMSEKQQQRYHKVFPFLAERPNTVISSIFSDETLASIKMFRAKKAKRSGWIVMGSPSWIKGVDDAKAFCEKNDLEYEVVWDLGHHEFLQKLAQAEGLVFLPKGGDTCPRMVIEAKLLGCKLELNDNVMHKDEVWFDTDDLLETESYLYANRQWFWNAIKADMEYVPTISGYTTTKNCVEQRYPFRETIKSMLGFCDEVIVVDGGSDDGTWEQLLEMAGDDERLRVYQFERDWEHKRFAVFDGAQKALARSLCTKEFCWQQDSDEIVHENDYEKVIDMVKQIPRHVPMVALPVIEYWGGKDKVRMDINPWKWRLSRNLPEITHGVPAELRRHDSQGDLYAGEGTDGCDYVRFDNYTPIPFANFFTPDIEQLRNQGLTDQIARQQFESWFNASIKSLPSVHHFSWFNIRRKIETYKNYWSQHWQSMYNIVQDDIPENNMFFEKPWSLVRDEEMDALAKKLADEMGGWIFHSRVDFSKPTPHIKCEISPPAVMDEWIGENS